MERPKRREQSIAWPRAAKPVLPRSTMYLFLVGGREAACDVLGEPTNFWSMNEDLALYGLHVRFLSALDARLGVL